MFSHFFIRRPIFASVLSIVIVLAGLVAIRSLPVAQYPEVSPPQVTVTAIYPGATAEALQKTVAAPIEEQINGVEGMLYLNSISTSSGLVTTTVTFEIGTDVDLAANNVSNRVRLAEPRLPEEVRRNGVTVQKRSNNFIQIVTLTSPGGRYDSVFLSNYASINLLEPLKRVPGVGDVQIFGARDYSMRVWLRPDLLAQYGLTTTDVASAVREQNAQFAVGKIGGQPAASRPPSSSRTSCCAPTPKGAASVCATWRASSSGRGTTRVKRGSMGVRPSSWGYSCSRVLTR